MPSYEASGISSADPERVWDAWTDVASWSNSEHIEIAGIDGPFRLGAVITSKAKGFPSSKLTVIHVERPALWTDESRSPGVLMTFDHVIEPVGDRTRLTERVVFQGVLGFLVGPLLRRRLEALFEASVAHVARNAEAAASDSQPPES